MRKDAHVWRTVLGDMAQRDRASCWIWPGRSSHYPAGTVDGKRQPLHRAVLAEVLGRPIAARKWACHTCDQPRCYNPDHLYEGDPKTNVADCRARGRLSRGDAHSLTRLSDEAVLAVFRDRRPSSQVARDWGVSAALVRGIRNGSRKRWLTHPLSTVTP